MITNSSKDSISIRINQLSGLHSQLNALQMNAKKMYVPVGIAVESTVVEVLETAKLSIKHEMEELRKQL
jgi:hypothetical protein